MISELLDAKSASLLEKLMHDALELEEIQNGSCPRRIFARSWAHDGFCMVRKMDYMPDESLAVPRHFPGLETTQMPN